MTPRELAFALGLLRPSPGAPGRAAFSALMQAFPDETIPCDGDEHGR